MVKTVLKILVAAILLYWLVVQGKLDFSLVEKSFQNPGYFVLGGLLISIQLLLGAFRLGYLLKIKSNKIGNRKLISIQWIGQLFATVLPGAFTSDLLKIGYVRSADQTISKSYILFSILADRIIGLNSLLFISGISSLIFFRQLTQLNSAMTNIIYLNITLFVASFLGMSLLFLKKKHQDILIRFIPTQKLKAMTVEIWKLSEHKELFLLAYLTSIFGHLLSITAFWIVNIPFFKGPLSASYLATLIPLGQLAVVLPISPGGIGVGHAAFATLFQFVGHDNGASLYNIYWLMCLVVSLLGMFPFILNRAKINSEEVHGS